MITYLGTNAFVGRFDCQVPKGDVWYHIREFVREVWHIGLERVDEYGFMVFRYADSDDNVEHWMCVRIPCSRLYRMEIFLVD